MASSTTSPDTGPIVDVHTHMYPPSYLSLLRSRKLVPYLFDPEPTLSDPKPAPRLIILPSDDDPSLPQAQRGRPLDPTYSSLSLKLSFMKTHQISTSIISLANPWLDFLSPDEAPEWARKINDDLHNLSATAAAQKAQSSSHSTSSATRAAAALSSFPETIYTFGTLPLTSPPPHSVTEIHRISTHLPTIKGIIIGTSGLGTHLGLDDPLLNPIWSALEETSALVFIHPHYGLPSSVFGPRNAEYGHVLPLSLGFPMETTIAVVRMWLCGVFDRFPGLRVLLAHAGGAAPFLFGRVESCVAHERHFLDAGSGAKSGGENENGGKLRKPKRGLKEVLRTNVWLDAVTYGPEALKAAVDVVGEDRVLFGTDHPFFPPIDGDGEGEQEGGEKVWESVRTNVEAIDAAFGKGDLAGNILGGNASKLFGI